jgi:hypothetical protein
MLIISILWRWKKVIVHVVNGWLGDKQPGFFTGLNARSVAN